MENQFGKYIETKRKEKQINLRQFAKDVNDMAPAYLSDIEKGHRYPPDRETIEKMAQILMLSQDETSHLFDLAAFDRASVDKEKSKAVSPDLPEFIMSSEKLRVAMRMARDDAAGDDPWIKVIEMLEERKKQSEE